MALILVAFKMCISWIFPSGDDILATLDVDQKLRKLPLGLQTAVLRCHWQKCPIAVVTGSKDTYLVEFLNLADLLSYAGLQEGSLVFEGIT
jgi:hypothetical protein